MSLIISLLVILLIAAGVFWVIQTLPIPAPWNRVFQGVVGLITLLVLLQRLGLFAGLG